MNRLLLAALVLAPAIGLAQEPARPPLATLPAFHFPKFQTHTLANGLRVIVVEDHSLQVVAARAVIGVDETFDPAGKEGLYQVMLGALREGTRSRTPAQLAEASAEVGTPVSPTSFTTTPSSFGGSLGIMGDMLMNPSFDQAGVDRRKAAQAAVFRNAASRVALVARNAFYALLNGRQDAVARANFGTEAGVASITPDDVRSFYDCYVGPKTTTLVIVGDVTDANAVATAKRVFGAWTSQAAPSTAGAPAIPAPSATKIYLADAGGANSTVYVGTTGALRDAPDAFAAEMLGTIVSNRMLVTLREKRSLVYGGNMVMNWHPAPRRAEFIGFTTVAATKTDSALTEWLGLLRSLRAAPPSDAELEAARRARVGALWSRIDGPDETARAIVESLRDGLPPNYLELYAKGMTAVTPADVAAAAAKYLDMDHLVIVVSGDRKVLEPALRASNLAPIVAIDASGRPLP